jgi:hypothetical protein
VCAIAYAAGRRKMKLTRYLVEALAGEIRPWRDCGEAVRVVEVPKASGGVRQTLQFGVKRSALSHLCRDVLEIVWGPSPLDYNRRGKGSHAAICVARFSIENANCWVGVADIKDAFPSFRQDGIAACVPLSKSVIRSSLLISEDTTFVVSQGLALSKSDRDRLRRGLPQGAPASSLIASNLIGRAISPFAHDVMMLHYADNILVARDTEEEAIATISTLSAHLKGHLVGDLTLHQIKIGHTDKGVPFLGYRITTDPKKDCYSTWAFPDIPSFERFFAKLGKGIIKYPHEQRTSLAITKANAWIASWTQWNPTEDRVDHVLKQAIEVAQAHDDQSVMPA